MPSGPWSPFTPTTKSGRQLPPHEERCVVCASTIDLAKRKNGAVVCFNCRFHHEEDWAKKKAKEAEAKRIAENVQPLTQQEALEEGLSILDDLKDLFS